MPITSRPPRRHHPFAPLSLLIVLLFCGMPSSSHARAGDDPLRERLRPAGIDGALVLGGGGTMPDAVLERFTKLAGGDKANIVLLSGGAPTEKSLEAWKARKPAEVQSFTLPIGDPDDKKLRAAIHEATGVWIADTDAALVDKGVFNTGVENELRDLLKRGGVLGMADDPGMFGRQLIADKKAKKRKPLDLLPGTVLEPHFLKGERSKAMFDLLDKDPGLVGFGIDEGTALIVRGRDLQVVGDSTVTVCLAASKARVQRTIELKSGASHDLTALRRAALARAEPPFPPKAAATPNVPNGTLVIIGGGGTPPEVMKKFIELAGGPDALIVILPQAYTDPIPTNVGVVAFERAGAKNVQVLRGRELKEIDDPKNLEILKKAKAIWFDGGRQWRFVDAFEGTKALDLMRDVLKRGGVIGGSSAGASIQADYLCRGSPLGNLEIMYEGYERGLGFLPGVAVDQHFTQRKRFDDMTALVKAYPQLLGIGIDESTAIIVTGSVAEVMGRNKVHFYDRKKPVEDGKPDYEALKAGERYDLKAREVLPTEEAKPTDRG